MTDDEIKEACRLARGWLDAGEGECESCDERAGGCSECMWSRALLAVVAQRDAACIEDARYDAMERDSYND